ncbi:speckle-type POZ protein B-like [Ornithodoros turicata]|uniref:speckle-type POZ protein B-like n=1 Tax=Ornithodoros turicata TaxID=34597 RepID=UPI003138F2BA
MSAVVGDVVVRSKLSSKLRRATCKATWLVESFTLRRGATGDYIESDKFSTGVDCDWCWRLYPWGKTNATIVQVELVYIRDGTISATCQCWLANETPEKVEKKEIEFRKFLPTQVALLNLLDGNQVRNVSLGYLAGDALTLCCELTTLKDYETSVSWMRSESPQDAFHEEELYHRLWECRDFSDLTVVADGKKFEVHKAILATRSPVFNAMFKSNMKEMREGEVHLEDMSAEVLQEMLSFIYTNMVSNIGSMAADLLHAADKYDLKKLKSMCEEELCSNLSVETVADTLRVADKFNADYLKNVALCYLNAHAVDVQETHGFKALVREEPRLVQDLYDALIKLTMAGK